MKKQSETQALGAALFADITAPLGSPKTSARPPCQIFVIDDHPIFREGLRKLLEAEPEFCVCGEAGSEKEALRKLKISQPDVAIIDVLLAGTNGIDLVAKLRKLKPRLPILVLSMHETGAVSSRALAAGAKSYVTKDAPVEQLIEELRGIYREALDLKTDSQESGETKDKAVECLSERELDILRLMGQGLGTRDIAERIGISGKTVETHRGKIRGKLQLRTGVDLLCFAEANFSAKE